MSIISHDRDVDASVLEAERAWLHALTIGFDALRALMLDDSHVVHGPVGKIDPVDSFVEFQSRRRHAVVARARDTRVTVRGEYAVVSCLQEMHIVFDEELPPFPIEEVVTRIWRNTDDGWRVAHMQQSKRLPPA
ncbi:nuclear transport factor 2 family protein [Rhodococcus sp. BP-149]|uniref:nuclear transport factor 2 family protein n=1 Tax=unclassified Rhodococcus (in: high G+C Gram-positive bacteria) TaxID=192944 RepID=UPI001C9A710E|nr:MULTISPECIES: nuclear transport factor 2 family protein [unclassified Rhodococcus (in: high G+C Gram-positive bacteria)]MBY6685630.1 nuclear transport factor 2 family protein [Rhodococcus sp. BP-288]MBY6694822.1 nuclear transport factor 2 family protein [Rhodococcus sp. BP-188]MBY6696668.1 nuclear transport factor 2 family protein [Rhodococcus sp. BP-285]MBY6703324.1 nuclear transport factor 2 family protein [Rhodococcus sp. BP-283]MBY6710722.1 nuclear transport factor 2 family protein [Rho